MMFYLIKFIAKQQIWYFSTFGIGIGIFDLLKRILLEFCCNGIGTFD